MATSISLSDAIDEFLRHRATQFRPNTVDVNKRSLSLFLREMGNMQVRHLDARHGEQYVGFLTGKGYKINTVNAHLTTLSAFCKWARFRKYLPAGNDPLGNTRQQKAQPVKRLQIDAQDFPRLLEAAHGQDPETGEWHGTPHDRIIVALGLFLFLRQSEIIGLKYGDVDLEKRIIHVTVIKTAESDEMPIGNELARELHRWLTWYANDVKDTDGPLQRQWYLVPRRKRPALANDGSGPGGGYMVKRESGNCLPEKPICRPHLNVQRTLRRFGVKTRGADGRSNMEGVHTLRRSGARAYFDHLVNTQYDGALQEVSTMLHHSNTAMTEKYLGVSVSKHKRNQRIIGNDMFPAPKLTGNVVPIRKDDDDEGTAGVAAVI